MVRTDPTICVVSDRLCLPGAALSCSSLGSLVLLPFVFDIYEEDGSFRLGLGHLSPPHRIEVLRGVWSTFTTAECEIFWLPGSSLNPW